MMNDVCPFYIPATDPDEPKGDCDAGGECSNLWLNFFRSCIRYQNNILDWVKVAKLND